MKRSITLLSLALAVACSPADEGHGAGPDAAHEHDAAHGGPDGDAPHGGGSDAAPVSDGDDAAAPARDAASPGPRDGGPHDSTPHEGGPRDDGAPDARLAHADADPPDAALAADAGPPPVEHPIPPAPVAGPPAWYDAVVLDRFPHDPAAFTQGLVYLDGLLYESTGLRGQSTVRIERLESGEVLQRRALDARYFGEGLAAVGDRLVQVTWQSGAGFVYDRASLAPLGGFAYPGEGWGLAWDGARLILSDGTARLRFLDPVGYGEIGSVMAHDGATAVTRLNELELIDGELFANVWLTDRIARIDPHDGRVSGWIDLAPLRPPGAGGDDVLNGIAWDAAGRRLLVTGKRWPVIYSIRLVERR